MIAGLSASISGQTTVGHTSIIVDGTLYKPLIQRFTTAISMMISPNFSPLARGLRDEIIEHYERVGQPLDSPSGLRTLDTNSILAAGRGRLLLRLLASEDSGPVHDRDLLDLGAGFGSLAVYFAHLGARVVAMDPSETRLSVAARVAATHDLPLTTLVGHGESIPLEDAAFDFVIANNSLCYVTDPRRREATMREIRRILRPGGWFAMRNPNRLCPRDQFTGLPLVAMMPRQLASRITKALGRSRSEVYLTSPWGATRELRRAGFVSVRSRHAPRQRRPMTLASYTHVLARRGAP